MSNPVDAPLDDDLLARASVRGGAMTTAAQGLRFLIRLVSQIAIARLLMPADYGLVAMVGPVLALVLLLADLGLGQAVVQRTSVTHSEVSTLFWVGLAVNCLLALFVFAISPLVAWAYGEPRLVHIIWALAALMPVSGLAAQHAALFTRNLRFGILATVDVVPPALGLAAGYAAALQQFGYWSLIIMTAVEAICATVLVCAASRWRPGLPRYDPAVWSMLRVGRDLTGYNLASYVTTTADNILLGMIHGEVVLGLYDKGYRTVTQPISQLLMPFGRVATPLFIRLRSDERRFLIAFRRITQLMLLAALPGILATMVFARPLVLDLLGAQWIAIVPVVSWLCLGATVSPLYSSTFWLFVSQHRTGEQLYYVAATSAFSIVGFVAGLPWGAEGVAAGASISFILLSTPLTCWGATRQGPVTAGALAAAVAPLAAAAVVTAAVLFVVGSIEPTASLLDVALMFAASYALFALSLATFRRGRQILAEAWSIQRLLVRGEL